MRMWMVNPKKMCRKHLLGEHVETHMFVGTILAGKSLDGYVENKLVETHNIKKRHKKLAEEIKRRGYNHHSKLPKFSVKKIGKVDRKDNLKELAKRCKECRELQNGKI